MEHPTQELKAYNPIACLLSLPNPSEGSFHFQISSCILQLPLSVLGRKAMVGTLTPVDAFCTALAFLLSITLFQAGSHSPCLRTARADLPKSRLGKVSTTAMRWEQAKLYGVLCMCTQEILQDREGSTHKGVSVVEGRWMAPSKGHAAWPATDACGDGSHSSSNYEATTLPSKLPHHLSFSPLPEPHDHELHDKCS